MRSPSDSSYISSTRSYSTVKALSTSALTGWCTACAKSQASFAAAGRIKPQAAAASASKSWQRGSIGPSSVEKRNWPATLTSSNWYSCSRDTMSTCRCSIVTRSVHYFNSNAEMSSARTVIAPGITLSCMLRAIGGGCMILKTRRTLKSTSRTCWKASKKRSRSTTREGSSSASPPSAIRDLSNSSRFVRLRENWTRTSWNLRNPRD